MKHLYFFLSSFILAIPLQSQSFARFDVKTSMWFCQLENDSFEFVFDSVHQKLPNEYHWNFGDGTTASGFRVKHAYAQPGSYQVLLRVTTYSPYFEDSVLKSVELKANPVPRLNSKKLCLLEPAYNITSPPNGITAHYNWEINNNYYASSWSGVSISFPHAGMHWVSIKVTYNNNCFSKWEDSVFVAPQVQPSFQAQNTCSYDSVAFVNYTVTNSNPVSYKWSFGDSSDSNLRNPKHLYKGVGTTRSFNVTLETNVNGSCPRAVTKTIVVNEPPKILSLQILQSDNSGLTYGIYNEGGQGAQSGCAYLWRLVNTDGSTIHSGQGNDFFVSWEDLKVYDSIIVRAKFDATGCEYIYHHQGIRRIGSAQQVKKEAGAIQLVENPVSEDMVLENLGNKALEVSLWNASGQLLWKHSLLPGRTSIPMLHLRAGVYLLREDRGSSLVLMKQ
jgi:hypothetical protein